MNNLKINSAKALFEVHKAEQIQQDKIRKNEERELLRDKKNDEYNQKALQIADVSKNISIISLIVAILALIISIFK